MQKIKTRAMLNWFLLQKNRIPHNNSFHAIKLFENERAPD